MSSPADLAELLETLAIYTEDSMQKDRYKRATEARAYAAALQVMKPVYGRSGQTDRPLYEWPEVPASVNETKDGR